MLNKRIRGLLEFILLEPQMAFQRLSKQLLRYFSLDQSGKTTERHHHRDRNVKKMKMFMLRL